MSINAAVNSFMVSIENPSLTLFSKIIHYLFEPKLMILVSLFITLFLFYMGKRKEGIVFGVSMALTGVLIFLAKIFFRVERPFNQLIAENGFSFPSGHALASTVFFGLIAYLLSVKKPRRIKTIIFLSWGMIVIFTAFSRIYLRVHWLTDVIGGVVIGCCILLIARSYLKGQKIRKHRRQNI